MASSAHEGQTSAAAQRMTALSSSSSVLSRFMLLVSSTCGTKEMVNPCLIYPTCHLFSRSRFILLISSTCQTRERCHVGGSNRVDHLFSAVLSVSGTLCAMVRPPATLSLKAFRTTLEEAIPNTCFNARTAETVFPRHVCVDWPGLLCLQDCNHQTSNVYGASLCTNNSHNHTKQ